MKSPARKELIGILTSVDELDNGMVLITVQDINDDMHTVGTSSAYWKKVGKFFTIDNTVKITWEIRIKDTTEYESTDAAGNKIISKHTSDGTNLVGINRFSSVAYQRMYDAKDMESGVAIIAAQEPDRVQAVATYLAAFVRK